MKVLLVLLLVGIASSSSYFSDEHEDSHPGNWKQQKSSDESSVGFESSEVALASANPVNTDAGPGHVWGEPFIRKLCKSYNQRNPKAKTVKHIKQCQIQRVSYLKKAPAGSPMPASSEEHTSF